MSDEELDKLFKDATENFSADNSMSNWDDMASKLDRKDKVSTSNRKVVTVILLSALLVGSFTYWYVDRSATQKQPDVAMVRSTGPGTQPTLEEPVISTTEHEENQKVVRESSAIQSRSNSRNEDVSNTSKEAEQLRASVSSVQSNYQKPIRIENQVESIVSETSEKGIHQIIQNGSITPSASSNLGIRAQADTTTILTIEEEVSEPEETVLTEEPEEEKQNRDMNKGFSIKMSIAPDFSSTELFKQGKPGINIGAMVGYTFTKRWSVFSGIILSKKIYSSTNIKEPYSSTSGYSYEVNQLDGDCSILDIPLNAYYSFNQDRSLSFKVGIGFSSYLMLSEEYTYYVNKSYGSNEYYQRIENENYEWFKLLNLSFVMQQRLKNRLFLEFEPFVKIPMAGIGAGDISLYTVGANVSLRYDFYKHSDK